MDTNTPKRRTGNPALLIIAAAAIVIAVKKAKPRNSSSLDWLAIVS